jgi:hypothetical protein
MTFKLEQLGPFRVEQTEDYKTKSHDNSYGEMIRAKGSKPKPPFFEVPSHVFKFSDKELGIYLHERKNKWRALSRLLNVSVDISDPEISIRFPVSKFGEVSKIIPFVRKKSRKTPSTDQERERVSHLRSYRTHIMRKNNLNFNENVHEGNLIQINVMNSKEGPR